MPAPDPTPLYRVRDGVYAPDLLIVAVAELDLFSWLAAAGPAAVSEVCAQFGLDPRPADVLATYCAALGLLDRDGDLLAVSELAEQHLVAGSAYDLRTYYASLLGRPGCTELTSVLRTGQPAAWASAGTADRSWARRLAEVDFARSFTAAMDARGAFLGPALADTLDDVPMRQVLDVGGGSGTYLTALLDRRPSLQGAVLDRPPMDSAARSLVGGRTGRHGRPRRFRRRAAAVDSGRPECAGDAQARIGGSAAAAATFAGRACPPAASTLGCVGRRRKPGRHMKIPRSVLGLGLAVTVLAGCGGGSTESPDAAGGTAQPGGPAATQPTAGPNRPAPSGGRFTQALLPESALPQGLQIRRLNLANVPLAQLRQQLGQIQVDPQRCRELTQATIANIEDPRGAVLVATRVPQGTVTNGVVPTDQTLSSTEQLLDECSELSLNAGQLSASSSIEEIDAPDVDAQQVLAYSQSTTFDLPPGAPQRAQQALEALGNTTTILMRDSGALITISVSGDPGVTAADLAPRALQQAQMALQ